MYGWFDHGGAIAFGIKSKDIPIYNESIHFEGFKLYSCALVCGFCFLFRDFFFFFANILVYRWVNCQVMRF